MNHSLGFQWKAQNKMRYCSELRLHGLNIEGEEKDESNTDEIYLL